MDGMMFTVTNLSGWCLVSLSLSTRLGLLLDEGLLDEGVLGISASLLFSSFDTLPLSVVADSAGLTTRFFLA